MAMSQYHTYDDHLSPNQCSSTMVRTIDAPLPLVWSMVRNFIEPQAYKGFVRDCTMVKGDGGVGSVRELKMKTGIPARSSTERLDKLDDHLHVMGFSIIGGEHRLKNYQSTTTLHQEEDNGGKTVLIESYVVDIPSGNTEEETRRFANTIIGINHKYLAEITEMMATEA